MRTVAVVVAHPDDVAYGLGGTLLRLGKSFHLHVICATRGERGRTGLKSMAETAAVREMEERAACERLGADLTFLDLIDREVFADRNNSEKLGGLLKSLNPCAVFTIWPVDSHPDHSAISEMTVKALFLTGLNPELYFCEESFGLQTTQFEPDIYVDITAVMEDKLELIRCHKCQNPNDNMAREAAVQAAHRGRNCRCGYAEGFKTRIARKIDGGDGIFNEIR